MNSVSSVKIITLKVDTRGVPFLDSTLPFILVGVIQSMVPLHHQGRHLQYLAFRPLQHGRRV